MGPSARPIIRAGWGLDQGGWSLPMKSCPPNEGGLLPSVEPSIHHRIASEERTTMTTTVNPRRRAAKAVKASPVLRRTFATHQELLDDMKAFGQRLVETPGAAREFLISAGLLTKNGKPKQLIRD